MHLFNKFIKMFKQVLTCAMANKQRPTIATAHEI